MELEKSLSGQFYSGTSGLLLPVPKYRFPAPFENASRLTYYASLYNSLEVNSSFYKIPQPSTIARWAASVPQHFRFTFKLWQGITHKSGLEFLEEDVVRFVRTIDQVGEKRGCLLIQCPPGIGIEYTMQLEYLLQCIRFAEWKIAVEFRHHSWYQRSTFELLNSYKAALVVHDMPFSATPVVDHVPDFIYVRFHGPTGDYKGSYSDDFLHEYAGYASNWLSEGKEVYMYFNNTAGDALKNLDSITHFIQTKQQKNA